MSAADSGANRMLHPMGMGLSDPHPSTVTTELLTLSGTQVVRVQVSRTFSFIPKGPLPTTPGAKGPFITLTDLTITGESIMDTQPGF